MISLERPISKNTHCLSCDSDKQVLAIALSIGEQENNRSVINICRECRRKLAKLIEADVLFNLPGFSNE